MTKVLIWDYVGSSKEWIKNLIDPNKVDIIATFTPADQTQVNFSAKISFDYLLIFEQNMKNQLSMALQIAKISFDKVIYALDISSWMNRPAAISALLKPKEVNYSIIHRNLDLLLESQLNDYITCTTVDGLSYIATSKDKMLMPYMYLHRQNHAAEEMEVFYNLSKKYYYGGKSETSRGGVFLDLGANIGTTCVYFKWKYDKKLKILAFEPDPTNFMLLKMNIALNHITEDTTLENCGLGDKESYQIMHINPENPGNNSMYPGMTGLKTEKIHIVKLDDYIVKNNIKPEEIKYIWLDTEGFEPQVLLGAENLIMNQEIPIFMEFNAMDWNKSGYYDKMVELLEKRYSKFIIILEYIRNNGKAEERPIKDLLKFKESQMSTGSMGDIFLIKK